MKDTNQSRVAHSSVEVERLTHILNNLEKVQGHTSVGDEL